MKGARAVARDWNLMNVPFRIATGPRGLPLIGVIRDVRKDTLGWLMRTALEHGPVAQYRFGPGRAYLVTHPEGLKHVLQDHVKNYTKDHFSYALFRRIGGDGLITSQGETWLKQRRLAQPAFHRARISAMAEQMVRAAAELAEHWSESQRSGTPRPVVRDMMALTLRIVGEALFGTDVRAEVEAVSAAFNVLSEQTVERFRSLRLLPPVLPTAYDRAFRQAGATLRDVVGRVIAERRKHLEDRGDLLSMFMLARDEETGEQMDDAHLQAEVLTMMLAGHETTATALAWTWVLLEQNPEPERKLHEELDAVLGGRLPTADDVPRLVYTRRVLDESLRLYPPVYVLSRKVVEDDTVYGYQIRGGASLDMSPYVTQRLPEFWPEPERFEPDRFTPEQIAARPRYAYFPFLGGPRQCIGSNFALMEGTLILATLAQRYRPRMVAGYTPRPEPLITLRPADELPSLITPRERSTTA
ncbi:cytochrome P450 [Hyalangium rubrum]|uniref:Cytochrome P450 n=1 Tax=Hyalangium rubrum TaxID=3103134 RepID=A0ABU5GX88_9BACT|nr:cytochrome P450 [Hyalangium sp. s54d21]MDY7225314.1 cytochrome P450 [Hyalangium sp. s54d21]